MATTTRTTRSPALSPEETPGRVVLREVPWAVYEALRDLDANRHVRMTYHDGVLELMSPEYIHEVYADRLGMIVRAVVSAFRIPVAGARATTLRRRGHSASRGDAKEPDTSFYIGAGAALIRGKTALDLDRDPPPDLAIEVDHTSDSASRLPIYAGLGVPEVWRFDIARGSLWIGRLRPDGTYETVERSVCLPMLTPALVLEALARSEETDETTWDIWLRDWARVEVRRQFEARPD